MYIYIHIVNCKYIDILALFITITYQVQYYYLLLQEQYYYYHKDKIVFYFTSLLHLCFLLPITWGGHLSPLPLKYLIYNILFNHPIIPLSILSNHIFFGFPLPRLFAFIFIITLTAFASSVLVTQSTHLNLLSLHFSSFYITAIHIKLLSYILLLLIFRTIKMNFECEKMLLLLKKILFNIVFSQNSSIY